MKTRYFEFHNKSKLLSGKNALDHISFELDNMMCKNPMLITDKMLVKFGHLKLVEDSLDEGGIQIGYIYDDVPADSSVKVCNEIAKLYKQYNCDSIIALGGGSVLDTSKGVNLVISSGADDLLEVMGLGIIKNNTIPLVMIPTTAGTGSEATLVAVIADKEKEVKMEFLSYNIVSDVAILDPRMTTTLPPKLTAATGLDALVHAIEAYTSKQKNPVSDAFAITAIRYIRQNLFIAIKDGKDEDARIGMSNASYMAGVAFSNSMVGMVHAIGHALGGVSHVPHGFAMTILLPWCMEYNYDKAGDLYGELLPYLIDIKELVEIPASKWGRHCIKIIKDMINELNNLSGIPTRLRDCNVNKEDFEKIANTAINDGAILVNIKEINKEMVMDILKKAY